MGAKDIVRSIADERGFYYDTAGLLNAKASYTMPGHPWVVDGQKVREDGPGIYMSMNIGYFGYYAGPEVYSHTQKAPAFKAGDEWFLYYLR